MEFKEREYQEQVIDLGMSIPRFNLFASPGMGKTVCMLSILKARMLMDEPLPALAIGPMRVAQTVWDAEIEKWAHLQGLKVAKLLGTPAERKAALRSGADIYTIHYGLLQWLAAELLGKWPFRTVFADESTRLKGMRCSYQTSLIGNRFLRKAGSKNAAALAEFAERTPFWINATGTPAPNGLKDLWGQNWYIDYGATLGTSYTAFTNRWFQQRRGSKAEQQVFDPLPHAFEEITQRIAPHTISVDAYDWFDCERPREIKTFVELPAKAMKQYKELHQEAVLKLSEETKITAVNAGAMTNKCLQLASGHIYDGDKTAHWVHDAKIERLKELIDELNGEPLLLAYHFKPDRERILQQIPGAEILPTGEKQKAVEKRWNKGKIPVLVVHPASAGHGLNLQHGGHNACIYSPHWDLELYSQVIERIGPVRQMQAGYKRIVNVYLLMAKGTFDEMVFDRLTSKKSVETAIREAVRDC